MSDNLNARLLVTGASGQFGAEVVRLLRQAGAQSLVAASRHPDKLEGESRRVDFDDPASLPQAFAGIERLLIVSTDALGEPGLRQRQHLAAIEAAAKAGVKHILYTSMPKPEPGSLVPFAPDHFASEQAIRASGLPFTILRNNWYAENLLLGLPQALASGHWHSAAGAGRTGYIPRADAARAAAAALVAGGSESRTLDITGAEALDVEAIAGLVRQVSGRPLEVVHVTGAQLETGLRGAGVPAPFAAMLAAFDANAAAGGFDLANDTVARLTGTPPQSLAAFLAANRARLG